MNSMQIKDKLKNISQNKKVDFNTLLRLYMYDRFIERLARSKYKDNFILKGGFYLSTLFGVENRFTMDIDTAIIRTNFTQSNVETMIKEIIAIDINDEATIEFTGITTIRQEDEYGGYRVFLCVRIENMRENFQIDIATGDPITPKEIIYNYQSVLSDDTVSLWAYNIETVIAEKLETILSRAEANGRTRDYYDIYLIYTKYMDNINVEHLRMAIAKTFAKRDYHGDIQGIFDTLKNSIGLRKRWEAYAKKYVYAANIEYIQIIECLGKLLEIVVPVNA